MTVCEMIFITFAGILRLMPDIAWYKNYHKATLIALQTSFFAEFSETTEKNQCRMVSGGCIFHIFILILA